MVKESGKGKKTELEDGNKRGMGEWKVEVCPHTFLHHATGNVYLFHARRWERHTMHYARRTSKRKTTWQAHWLKPHSHRLDKAYFPLGGLWHGQKKTSKAQRTSSILQGGNQQDRKWKCHPRRDLEGKLLIQGLPWPCAWALTMCRFNRRVTMNSLAPSQWQALS